MIGTLDEVRAARRANPDKEYIDRICPFQQDETFCGDWCPHFSIVRGDVQLTCSGLAIIVKE